jgi:DNA-binding transcriptional MocR family regulator
LRWVVIRLLSKVLGRDLRVAPLAGDRLAISRVEGRHPLGSGWVSHILQQTAANLWQSAARKLLPRTARIYAERRAALVDALAVHGIRADGRSGLGIWVPLSEEVAVFQHLLERGWAVSPGELYRFSHAARYPDNDDGTAAAGGETARRSDRRSARRRRRDVRRLSV